MSRKSLFLLFAYTVTGGAVVCALAIHVVVPPLVSAAFHGQSRFEFLNDLFARQPPRPLSLYISYAQTSVLWIGILAAAVCLAAVMALDKSFQVWWDRVFGSVDDSVCLSSIPKARRFTVIGAIGAFTLLSLTATLLNVELWPFSAYSMYSNSRPDEGPAVERYRLYGVTETEPELELVFPAGEEPHQPFQAEAVLGCWSLRGNKTKTRQGMVELLTAYTARRLDRTRMGPRFGRLRLYREEWDNLQPDASNKFVPDRRVLVEEVSVLR